MTWRKLFLILLTGATVVLAGAWWLSFRSPGKAAIHHKAGNCYYGASLDAATIRLERYQDPFATEAFIFGPVLDDPFASERTWDWERDLLSSTGKFGMEKMGPDNPFLEESVSFPIWFPYLLFIAAAFALTRWMGRRALRFSPETPHEPPI